MSAARGEFLKDNLTDKHLSSSEEVQVLGWALFVRVHALIFLYLNNSVCILIRQSHIVSFELLTFLPLIISFVSLYVQTDKHNRPMHKQIYTHVISLAQIHIHTHSYNQVTRSHAGMQEWGWGSGEGRVLWRGSRWLRLWPRYSMAHYIPNRPFWSLPLSVSSALLLLPASNTKTQQTQHPNSAQLL